MQLTLLSVGHVLSNVSALNGLCNHSDFTGPSPSFDLVRSKKN